ncbi:MAG: heavy metal translocating P-type ATPase [Candidatus Binatia bacterium]
MVEKCRQCGFPSAGPGEFCCYGCELAYGLKASGEDDGGGLRTRVLIAVFFAMNLMAVSMFLYSEDVYGPASDSGMLALRTVFRWASALLATPVVFIVGLPMARRALAELCRGRMGVDLLVSGGAFAAWAYSLAVLPGGTRGLYFDAACVTLILVSFGRYLEASSRSAAASTLAARLNLEPAPAYRLGSNGCWEKVALADIRAGNRLRVSPGSAIPVDGLVTSEVAEVDEAFLTGEPDLKSVARGEPVMAGATVGNGALEIKATGDARSSSMALYEEVLRRAASERSAVEGLADRVAACLAPIMFVVSLATFVAWMIAGDVDKALSAALAVVVVACPCSFGLATPIAIRAAIGRALRNGVYFRGGSCVERLASVRAAALDKTGTVTSERRRVDSFEGLRAGTDVDRVIARVAAVEQGINHPLSPALLEFAKERGLVVPAATEVEVIPGVGLHATVEGVSVAVGGKALLERSGLSDAPDLERPGSVAVVEDGAVVAVIRTTETLRSGACAAVDELARLGLHVELVSGDAVEATASVAEELGISGRAECKPESKLAYVEQLQSRYGPVVMVGDGLNDGPALARASVGVALDRGSDMARAVSPLGLAGNDLRLLPWALRLSRKTMRIIRQNFTWALAYNSVCVALAASGHLNPMIAALAMLGSSITVLLNSLRVGRFPAFGQQELPT